MLSGYSLWRIHLQIKIITRKEILKNKIAHNGRRYSSNLNNWKINDESPTQRLRDDQ